MSPGRGEPKYLSPEHMNQVKFVVQEAQEARHEAVDPGRMRLPQRVCRRQGQRASTPQLTMQGLDADIRISVMPGQTLTMPAPPDTLGALAVFAQTGAVRLCRSAPAESSGGPPRRRPAQAATRNRGSWCWSGICSAVLRPAASNRADGTRAKDSQYSLIDYLNPDATRAFLKITHETYKQAVGDEFGKTVLGFFGDEPDYTGFMPWTPKLLDEFRQQKGYDLQPYLPLLFAPKMTDEAWRVKADYWDVWSGMFRETFFGVQAEWCAKNNVEYLVHLNHEEQALRLDLPEDLIRNEGDFFRDMRHVEVPGIDNLSQLVPERGPHAGRRPGTSTTTSPSWPLRRRTCSAGPRSGPKSAADRASTASSSWIFNWCAASMRMQIRVPVMRARPRRRRPALRRRRRPCWRGTPTGPAI